jgi:hypothetical protein
MNLIKSRGYLPFLGRLIFLAIFTACGNHSPIDVADLVKNANAYNGQIITVEGCYYLGFETEVLAPCKQFNLSKDAIWIDRYSMIQEREKWLGEIGARNKSDLLRPASGITEKEKQMESQLAGTPKAVIIRGEFRFSDEPKFGHLNNYKCYFILHQVLSIMEAKQFTKQISP